jgi:hypothetical protein
MRARHLAVPALAATLLLLPRALPAQTSQPAAPESRPASSELKAEVPELTAYHEVIFELWHKAWPEKDAALMKELLPRAQKDFVPVKEAKLPGILRDRQAAWDAGLKTMAGALDDYGRAAGADNLQGMLDAVETLHSAFEQQMRIVRPPMKELDAFHVELYQIYHHSMPEKQLGALRAGAERMGERCGELAAAPPPRRYTGPPEALKEKVAALCAATSGAQKAAAGDDWKAIEAAVESVHSAYLDVLALFDAGH